MGHQPWTKRQVDILIKYYGKLPTQEVAKMLDMKPRNVAAYAHRHGYKGCRYWTKEQEKFLVKNYGKKTLNEIAQKIGKSYQAVRTKAHKLGLCFDESVDEISLAELSRLVGRDNETIKTTWVKHGLNIIKKEKHSLIDIDELIKFMQENPRYWKASDCEEWFFQRYDFFNERLKEEKEEARRIRWAHVDSKMKN